MSKNQKILVADDDADIRGIIAGCITMLGHEVLEAADGSEAVSIFNSQPLDLAVLDYMMPGLDGLEVAKQIKASQEGSYIPVLLLTARGSLSDKVKAFECGVDDYLTKPFHYEELQARVTAQLRLRELNLTLHHKNKELEAAQKKIVEQERQLVAVQLMGAASHNLGQPLSAIILNCHLIDKLSADDSRYKQAIAAIKSDSHRMASILESLRSVNANRKQEYYAQTDIINVDE